MRVLQAFVYLSFQSGHVFDPKAPLRRFACADHLLDVLRVGAFQIKTVARSRLSSGPAKHNAEPYADKFCVVTVTWFALFLGIVVKVFIGLESSN